MKFFRMLFIIMMVLILAFPVYGESHNLALKHMVNDVKKGKVKKIGRHNPKENLHLSIVLPLNNQAELENFLKQLNDRAHPNYHKYLSVEEFTERFGSTQKDYDEVIKFAESKKLRLRNTHRNRLVVDVEGNTEDIEKALNIQINDYQHPKENRRFFHPDKEPTIDAPVKIRYIDGLNNHTLPKPNDWYQPGTGCLQAPYGNDPGPCTGSSSAGSFLGSDMRAAYYGGTALTGAGQSVCVTAFYPFDMADVNLMFTSAGQSISNVRVIPVSVDGTSTNMVPYAQMDLSRETVLDIYSVMTMAPGLKAVYPYISTEGGGTAMLSKIASENRCKQISNSWGLFPTSGTANDAIFQQMAAQGQTFFTASGDWHSWNDPTNTFNFYPESNPYVTSVGGTVLETTGPGGSYVTEKGWTFGGGGYAGPDTFYTFAIPYWQQYSGVITAENQASSSYRNGPDVAMEANSSWLCAGGLCQEGHIGTSWSSPRWAGYMALINQQSVANGNGYLGFLNPTLYQIGVGANYSTNFNDIVEGNNGFPAVAGFDLVTGWGSPKPALINTLAGSPPDGMCGPAVNMSAPTVSVPPSSNLCTSGTASQVTCASNTCTWTCASGGTSYYYVTPSAGTGGSIVPSSPQYIVSGGTTQFTYIASGGYDFLSWGGTCGGSGTTTYTTNAITADCTVTANFVSNGEGNPTSVVRGILSGGSVR